MALLNVQGKEIKDNDVYAKSLSKPEARAKLIKAVAGVEAIDINSYSFDDDPDNAYM